MVSSKDDDGEEDWEHGVDQVPHVGRQPIAGGTHSTHKLQVLGLEGEGEGGGGGGGGEGGREREKE